MNPAYVKRIKKELTSLEKRYIKFSNALKIMDLCHTQAKLLDIEHAWGRVFCCSKIVLFVLLLLLCNRSKSTKRSLFRKHQLLYKS